MGITWLLLLIGMAQASGIFLKSDLVQAKPEVRLGMSYTEVEKILGGRGFTMFAFGAIGNQASQVIYPAKGITITYVAGKVVHVQKDPLTPPNVPAKP
jgi:hypothetical protein